MLLKRNSVKKYQDGGQVRQSRSNNSFVDSGLAQAGTQHVTVDISHKAPKWKDKPSGQGRRAAASASSSKGKDGMKGYTSDIEYATAAYNSAYNDLVTWAAGVDPDDWDNPDIVKTSNDKEAKVRAAENMMSQTENIKDTFDPYMEKRHAEAKDAPAIDFNTGPGYALVNEVVSFNGEDGEEHKYVQTNLVTIAELNKDIANGSNRYSALSIGDAVTERRNNSDFSKFTPAGGIVENMITKSTSEKELETGLSAAFDGLGIFSDETQTPMLVQGVGPDGQSYNMSALTGDKTSYAVPLAEIAAILDQGGDVGVQVTEKRAYKTNSDALKSAAAYTVDKIYSNPALKEAMQSRAMYLYSNLSKDDRAKYKDFDTYYKSFSENKISDYMKSKYKLETKTSQEVSGHRPDDGGNGGKDKELSSWTYMPLYLIESGDNVQKTDVKEFHDKGKQPGDNVDQAFGSMDLTVDKGVFSLSKEHEGAVFTPNGLATNLSLNGNRWQTKSGENIQDYLDNKYFSGVVETPAGSSVTVLRNIPSKKDPHTGDWVIADDVMRFYTDMRRFAADGDRLKNKYQKLRTENPDTDLKILQKKAYDETYNEYLNTLPKDKKLEVQNTAIELQTKNIRRLDWAAQDVFVAARSGEGKDFFEDLGAKEVTEADYKAVIDRSVKQGQFLEAPGELNLYNIKIKYPMVNRSLRHVILTQKESQNMTPTEKAAQMAMFRDDAKSELYGNNYESFLIFSGDSDEGIQKLLEVPEGK